MTTKSPKFEFFRGRDGSFRFRLKAPNGEIIAASEGYTRKRNCLHGIAAVRHYARKARIVEVDG